MVSVNFQSSVNFYPMSGVNRVTATPLPVEKVQTSNYSAPKVTQPTFQAEGYRTSLTFRTELTTRYEKKKYKEIAAELDMKYRKKQKKTHK